MKLARFAQGDFSYGAMRLPNREEKPTVLQSNILQSTGSFFRQVSAFTRLDRIVCSVSLESAFASFVPLESFELIEFSTFMRLVF